MFLIWVVFIVGLATIAIKTLLFFKEKRERKKILEKIPAPKEQFFFGHTYIYMGHPGKFCVVHILKLTLLFSRQRIWQNTLFCQEVLPHISIFRTLRQHCPPHGT